MKLVFVVFSVFSFLILIVFNLSFIMEFRVGYFKQDKQVYFRNHHSWKWGRYQTQAVNNADLSSFKSLSKRYAVDEHQAYFEGNRVEGADVQTFTLLKAGNTYAKDKRAVYFGKKILSTDSENFEVLAAGYAKDSGRVYRYGVPNGQGFDADSFEFIQGDYHYPADKFKITYEGREIIGADRTTFKILDKGYSQDKYRRYQYNKPVPGGDLAALDLKPDGQ